jgi:hypothetical protein
VAAIVVDESEGGLGLLVHRGDFMVDDEVMVRLRDAAPAPARVRWIRQIERHVFRLGCEWFAPGG